MTNWLESRIAQQPVPVPLVLPQRFADAALEHVPEGPLKEATTEYLRRFLEVAPQGVGCLFVGRARTYKTYATAVIARRVHGMAHLDVEFAQCAVLAAQIERARFTANTSDVVTRIKDAGLVVMDDFAQVQPNSFPATVLMEIAESRFSAMRPTLWTANIDAGRDITKAIANLYGAGFARRVYDASEGFRVKVT